MKLEFGNYKILITAGSTKDKKGMVRLQKLLHVGDIESVYDIPIDLVFDTSESIDTLMDSLQYAREMMYEE